MWELERGPDELYDILKDGQVQSTALDGEQVLTFFEKKGVDINDVQGGQMIPR